ncbi:MAG: hypothetical protein GY772_28425 [bacterium]|nr:hypothetical protein [bacterium]
MTPFASRKTRKSTIQRGESVMRIVAVRKQLEPPTPTMPADNQHDGGPLAALTHGPDGRGRGEPCPSLCPSQGNARDHGRGAPRLGLRAWQEDPPPTTASSLSFSASRTLAQPRPITLGIPGDCNVAVAVAVGAVACCGAGRGSLFGVGGLDRFDADVGRSILDLGAPSLFRELPLACQRGRDEQWRRTARPSGRPMRKDAPPSFGDKAQRVGVHRLLLNGASHAPGTERGKARNPNL